MNALLDQSPAATLININTQMANATFDQTVFGVNAASHGPYS